MVTLKWKIQYEETDSQSEMEAGSSYNSCRKEAPLAVLRSLNCNPVAMCHQSTTLTDWTRLTDYFLKLDSDHFSQIRHCIFSLVSWSSDLSLMSMFHSPSPLSMDPFCKGLIILFSRLSWTQKWKVLSGSGAMGFLGSEIIIQNVNYA